MKKRYRLIFAGCASLVILIVMFMWLTGSFSREGKIAPGKHEVEETSASGLRTIEVKAVTIPVQEEAVGTVTARETAEISSRIMATITKVNVDAGAHVEKGQTLIVLDSRDAEARVKQAREALASAEATREQASLDAGRIERLYEKQAATKQEYDRSQTALKMAAASAEAASAAVREAEVNLSYAKVRSPMSGKVIDRLADPGDMAAPGKPLMSVYDPSTLRLDASLAEHLRSKVNVGDAVTIAIDTLGKDLEGTIVEIVPASDASSRSFTARISIPQSEPVYPGMYGRIRLPVGSAEAILIPPEAVEHVGQLEIVTVVENGIARTRSVKVGKTHSEGVEILSGLVAGEVIAVP
ncbi:MAG: efflux RND transporter periplasmic adaptor subunit [Candidatus Abyssobacteria bacterium SURF_17]|uniref:Efflux RND transporter periplasmic adaptor subunit n=1 Tax=Candidatus Abyssobacteria bacterium SURF_17 TaxID=2093361 RepID=A0A419EMT0_9BACT|nr:MAG: efflux RND transporter periplasmic adaptor subunit [Candidatus Abyssubacteria bacterium SURF_17]